jgi:gliding motility-associated-like protein
VSYSFKNWVLIFGFLLVSAGAAEAQLVVTSGQTAATLAATLAGPGVTVSSPVLTCPGVAEGTFTFTGASPLSMASGIVLTNGHATACAGTEGPLVSYNLGVGGDPMMASLLPSGTSIVDACYLDFDMVAAGDSIGFNYQFGSEEYRNAVCSIYTDVFGFFISGPGIVGTPNIALVPGTSIPVEINSVNNGTPGTVGGAAIGHCTALGVGSPFTTYYIDNTGGTLMTYRGYTKKLRAAHAVTPCNTYHLHISIVDAGNWQYDSGVFIEAASLTSNSYSFDHALAVGATINGVANSIVKGCTSTSVTIRANHASAVAQVLDLSYGGTVVNGVDVATLPNTVNLPAGDTTLVIPISGLPTPISGTKNLILYLSDACGIQDSISVNVMDTPFAAILTPDTTMCPGSVTIRTTGSAGLTYSWTPATGLSSTTVPQPIATPTVTTTYVMTATLPGSGCPPIVRDVTISRESANITMLTPDTTICLGDSVLLRVGAAGVYNYSWSPVTGLNNATMQDPMAGPSSTTSYTVTAIWAGTGCPPATANVTITVQNVNISLFNHDTSICAGASVNMNLFAAGAYNYVWKPGISLNDSIVQNPVATPTATTTYTVTATAGPCSAFDTVTVALIPTAVQYTQTDTICLGASDSVNLSFAGAGGFSFVWSPTTFVSNPTIANPLITPTYEGNFTYAISVTTGTSLCPVTDIVNLLVVPDSLVISPRDTAICYGQSVQVRGYASPLFTMQWIPTAGIGTSTIVNPLIVPDTSAMYVITAQMRGCPGKSDTMWIDVQPVPTLFAGNNRFVCQNDTIHLTAYVTPQWYTHYAYSWSPGSALFDSVSATVVFKDTISREEVLTVTTPAGCIAKDSLYITVYPSEFLGDLPNMDFCPGDSAVIKPTVSMANITYRWIPPMYLSDSTSANPTVTPITNQDYMLVGTSQNGCKDTSSFSIIVHPAAVIYLGDSVLLYPGETYQINPQTNCTQFNWFPPYGLSDPTASNPIASPDYNSKYTVTASTVYGCSTVDSISIYLDPESIIWVPNAFTPGNGPNNYIKVFKRGLVNLNYFRIYNRWGNLLYESNNIDAGWDGSYEGVPQPFDVYVYTAEAVTNTGKLINRKGNFTLLR